MITDDRRLIEDYLPLDMINALSEKDKKHPKHPIALVHYWPARRPTPACRAAVYATLVPAVSSLESRAKEGEFLSCLVKDFSPNPTILNEAKRRVTEAAGNQVPRILDQFAGRGPIPLEAARLGCEAYAVDYNPVAHLIELCTLVYPQVYGLSLADDVEHWGKKVLRHVERRVEHLYPSVQIPRTDAFLEQLRLFGNPYGNIEKTAVPVAFIWARTVPCRRPGCDASVPLVRQAWLRKKGGVVASVPQYDVEKEELRWTIVSAASMREVGSLSAQTGAGEAMCLACSSSVPADYVQECGRTGTLKEVPAAVVVEGHRSKLYVPPDCTRLPDMDDLRRSARELADELDVGFPDEPFQGQFQNIPNYGFKTYSSTFNGRQLLVMMELVRAIREVRDEMHGEILDPDLTKAIATYLSMMVGRFVNYFMAFCRWQGRDQITIGAIGDQNAMKMVYDYSEINPFARTAGALSLQLDNEVRCIRALSLVQNTCNVERASADKLPFSDEFFDAIITDPPYYGSVFYSDASAIFYVWHKRLIGDLYPEHFALSLPGKRKEAVAQPEVHDGSGERARKFYESLMSKAFLEARRVLKSRAPLVVQLGSNAG